MFGVVKTISANFWREDIWLPPNITWTQFESDTQYAQFSDLFYTFPMAFLFVAVRHLMENKFFRPIGKFLQIKSGKVPYPTPNFTIESALKNSFGGKLDGTKMKQLSLDTGLSEMEISRWIRQRSQSLRLSPLDKFSETGWRWLFYLTAHVLSVGALWQKPWIWNTRLCWFNYPFHPIDPAVWWHYILEISFYWSLLITQFFDVKRKDFWEMFIHHIATLALMVLSFSNHMHRMGSIVLLVHDFSDHWVELAKLAIYTRVSIVGDISFVIFGLTWAYTRLGIFPSWLIYSTTVEAANFVQMFPVYYIFNFLMTTLLILHVIWFGFIVRMAFKVMSKENASDNRSDSESDYEAESMDKDNDKVKLKNI